MIKVAIVGYGNIGKYAVDALRAAPDMELAGIVRRPGSEPVHGIKTASSMEDLGHVDAALLCTPTRSVEETALPLLARGINTVDSFDIHGDIVNLRHVYERAVLREHGIERRHGVALRLGKLVIITLHQFRISFRGRSQRPENYPVFGSCQRLFRHTEPVQQRKPFAFCFRHRQSRRRIGRSEITFVFLLKKIPQIGVMVTVAVPRTARRNTQQVERLKRSRARTVQRRGQSLADDVGTRQVQLHQLFLQ